MYSYEYAYGYPDELMHYGIKGMKWGVRRSADYYQGKANRAAAKIGTSKTRLGKSIQNNIAYTNEVRANRMKTMAKNEKNIIKKIDNVYGHGSLADRQKAASNYFERKATYQKTKYGKTQAEAAAFNTKSAAKANEKLHNSNSLKQYGKNYVDAIANRPIKTWSGRTTTTGERAVDNMLTGGFGGFVQDVDYYKNKK